MIYGGLGDSTDLSCAIEGRGREGWLKVGAHVGYEDDAQEQIQQLPILVLHLLHPLLRHGCAARGSPPPSVCAGNLGSSCFFYGILAFLLGKKPSPSATLRELFSSWAHYWARPGRFLFFPPDFLCVKMGSSPLIH